MKFKLFLVGLVLSVFAFYAYAKQAAAPCTLLGACAKATRLQGQVTALQQNQWYIDSGTDDRPPAGIIRDYSKASPPAKAVMLALVTVEGRTYLVAQGKSVSGYYGGSAKHGSSRGNPFSFTLQGTVLKGNGPISDAVAFYK